ncbi:MAG TPA: N-acetylglucosamine-6-phosphate deacetylase [Jatrophihabitans sp.]|nr:N-acetylglucosamine-6-phosphate deacetylase [Jatrophihabitans sp.]
MNALHGARLVTSAGVLDDAWLELSADRIAALGTGPVPAAAHDLGGGYLVPGFIDVHVHGGGGNDFTASAAELAAGIAFHRRHGTTRNLVSLMAGSLDALCEQLGWLVALSDDRVAGAHLEGPFLSRRRCGAQNSHHLQLPDRQVLAKLLEAGQGLVRTMTIAPELPGALEVIDDLVAAGGIAAIGHTDASYEQALAGFAAGARLTTHLYNAMPTIRHRAPGAAVAALESAEFVELINDGVHVHPAMLRLVDPARIVLVTDAMSATGVGDGSYVLGGLPVTVAGGQARSTETGALAGSTLTMDVAFRRAVTEVGLSLPDAVRVSSTNPARLLGIQDRCGDIRPGLAADLVHLADDLTLRRVMVAGRWLS